MSLSHSLAVTVLSDSLFLDQNKGLVYYHDKLFTGTSISFHSNDSIASKKTYVNGKKHGLFVKWYPSGVMSFQVNYHMGKQHGKKYTWWKNNNLRSESNFVYGVAEGIQMQYYESGAKLKLMHLKNGEEQGMQKSWRENGKIYNNYEAKNDRIFGLKRSKLCFSLEDEKF